MAHRPREHGRITAAGDSDDAAVPFGDRLAKEERSEHRHERERQHERCDQREHYRQRHWAEHLALDALQAEDRQIDQRDDRDCKGGSQKPRALTRTTYFYIDPRGPLADPELRFGEIEFKPRLFFYDRGLWETALKLKSLVENPGSMQRQYAEALGIVLTHELVRINGEGALREPVSRGGRARREQKGVAG